MKLVAGVLIVAAFAAGFGLGTMRDRDDGGGRVERSVGVVVAPTSETRAAIVGGFLQTLEVEATLEGTGEFVGRVTDGTGAASLSLPVPASPGNLGQFLFAQWMGIDVNVPATNPAFPLAFTEWHRINFQR